MIFHIIVIFKKEKISKYFFNATIFYFKKKKILVNYFL